MTASFSQSLPASIGVVSIAVAAATDNDRGPEGFAAASKEEDAPTTASSEATSVKLKNLSSALVVLPMAAADKDDVTLFFDSREGPSPGGGVVPDYDSRRVGRGGLGAAVVSDQSMVLSLLSLLLLLPSYSS